jgi:hypothetical protein
MRKLTLLLVTLALIIGYAAWPAWSAWQLRSAVKARDLARIQTRVDWPLLRANLKRSIDQSLASESASAGPFTQAITRTLGTVVADKAVDAAVTPGTLAHVLAGHVLIRQLVRETPSSTRENAEPTDPLSPRQLRWAFFESPTRFRFETADVSDPQRRIISIFELEGVTWKLVDVSYRRPA